jgi:ABC-2 type transport system ATP-binding protein
LSKGQRTQLALVTAVCAEPDLLVLDEPTSGLDPIVRREFIQTVIGAYQDGAPGRRTVFVSTHLISEFEGLIDEFTIIDRGREVLTLDADAARERYQKIQVRFATDPGPLDFPQTRTLRRQGRTVEIAVNGNASRICDELRARAPEALAIESLTLEEIFVSTLQPPAGLA